MYRVILAVLASFAVSACTTSQPAKTADAPAAAIPHYANAQKSFQAIVPPRMTPKLDQAGVPHELQQQLFDCMWHSLWGSLNPDEQAALDTAARNGTHVQDPAMQATLARKTDQLMNDPIPVLQQSCPDTIAQLHAYFH